MDWFNSWIVTLSYQITRQSSVIIFIRALSLPTVIIHHSSFIIHHSSFVIHFFIYSLFIYSLFIIHDSWFMIHDSWFMIHDSPFVIHLFMIHDSWNWSCVLHLRKLNYDRERSIGILKHMYDRDVGL